MSESFIFFSLSLSRSVPLAVWYSTLFVDGVKNGQKKGSKLCAKTTAQNKKELKWLGRKNKSIVGFSTLFLMQSQAKSGIFVSIVAINYLWPNVFCFAWNVHFHLKKKIASIFSFLRFSLLLQREELLPQEPLESYITLDEEKNTTFYFSFTRR